MPILSDLLTPRSARFHRVQYGETLASIAELYYGKPEYAGILYRHNDQYIENPNNVSPGINIVIPYLEEG